MRVYSNDTYRPYFNNSGDEDQITSITISDNAKLGTTLENAWTDAKNVTSFSCPFSATSQVTNMKEAWWTFSSLESFPLIDTSSVTDMGTWYSNSSLTEFPLLNTSLVGNMGHAWFQCTGLESFPLIDTSSCSDFTSTWRSVEFIDFPKLDFSSGTNFNRAWFASKIENFPPNMFDVTGNLVTTAFTFAWINGSLSAQSIENILVSLDTNGRSNIRLSIGGGQNASKTTWSTDANTAYNNLITKGWTIDYNA